MRIKKIVRIRETPITGESRESKNSNRPTARAEQRANKKRCGLQHRNKWQKGILVHATTSRTQL